MMQDFHVHTTYCDGDNTPEEMVLSAIEKGLSCIGFSCHSYTDFDQSYCIKKEKIKDYKAEISNLKEKYKRKIRILCGIEQDMLSTLVPEGYDYSIGSLHYVLTKDGYEAVDSSEEDFIKTAEKMGGFINLCENYYEMLSHLCDNFTPNIIGHFDLVTKYNEGGKLFDESDIRYINAWKKTADILLSHNIPFEINTGAISRGYRTTPYPSASILEYLKKKGAKLILSGDSHSKDTLCFQFDKWNYLI